MSFRSELHAYIRDTLNLAVTPIQLSPKPMLPALDYLTVSGDEGMAHDGPIGLVEKRIQFDVWAGNDADKDDVATRLRQALNGYRGPMGTVDIGSVFYAGERDLNEPDRKLFRTSIDFIFTYYDTVPTS